MSNIIFQEEQILIITLTLTVYYAIIGLWIYLQKLRLPTSGDLKVTLIAHDDHGAHKDISRTPFADTSEVAFKRVESLKERLREIIGETFYKNMGRTALLENLSRALQKYPELIGSPFQEGLQGFIISECNRHGPVGLRAYELKELWNADS